MAFMTTCMQKGCHKNMTPYIDPKTDKVYCEECDAEISNITYFAKVQMKSLKQYKKKVNTSFAVKCVNCGKEDRPKLVKDDVVCPSCNKPHSHLSEPFKIMLREKLKTAGSDI